MLREMIKNESHTRSRSSLGEGQESTAIKQWWNTQYIGKDTGRSMINGLARIYYLHFIMKSILKHGTSRLLKQSLPNVQSHLQLRLHPRKRANENWADARRGPSKRLMGCCPININNIQRNTKTYVISVTYLREKYLENPTPYISCSVCNTTSSSIRCLNSHMNAKHPEIPKPILECNIRYTPIRVALICIYIPRNLDKCTSIRFTTNFSVPNHRVFNMRATTSASQSI